MTKNLILCLGICSGLQGVERFEAVNPETAAKIVEANYCFTRLGGLNPERIPAASLALRLRIQLTYRNTGGRPLILPLEHERTVYTSLAPGLMRMLREHTGIFDPGLKPMKRLPDGISPDNPLDPQNNEFAVIAPGAWMKPAIEEQVTVPVYRTSGQYVDLRGHRLYLRLKLRHQPLTPDLEAELSDWWSRYGVPCTGTLTTNTMMIEIPASPQAVPCQ